MMSITCIVVLKFLTRVNASFLFIAEYYSTVRLEHTLFLCSSANEGSGGRLCISGCCGSCCCGLRAAVVGKDSVLSSFLSFILPFLHPFPFNTFLSSHFFSC